MNSLTRRVISLYITSHYKIWSQSYISHRYADFCGNKRPDITFSATIVFTSLLGLSNFHRFEQHFLKLKRNFTPTKNST